MSHRTDPRRGRLPAVASLALIAVLIVAACGQSNPPPSPSASPAPTLDRADASPPSASASPPAASADPTGDAIYDAVEEQVVAIRGLKPSRPVERQFISEAELRVMITEMFDEDTPPAYLAANERLYKALGLIPATSDLRDLSLDLLSGGVAGFYRNDQGKLYVVSKSRRTRRRTSASTSPTSTTTPSRTRTPRSSRTRTGSSTRATACSPARPSTRATRRC